MAPLSRPVLVVTVDFLLGGEKKFEILQHYKCESAAVQPDFTMKLQLHFCFLSIIAIIISTLLNSFSLEPP